jgi:hypothetical protein
MKITTYCIAIFLMLFLGDNVFALSPMPEEIKAESTATVCNIQIIALTDSKKGIIREVTSSTLTFGSTTSKLEVWEKINSHTQAKLNEKQISNIKIECTFTPEH